MRYIVYTAISGDYDDIRPNVLPDAERFIFLEPRFYEHEDPCRRAKYCKILAHRVIDCDYSLWLDGHITLNPGVTFKGLVDTYLQDTDIAVMKHPSRYCIFEEGAECIRIGKGNMIEAQLERYALFPRHNGLAELGVILRRHTDKIVDLNRVWWHEVCMGSTRDQISFPVVIRGTETPCRFIEGRPFFSVGEHKRRMTNDQRRSAIRGGRRKNTARNP
jgi:hypothetical protein